LLKYRQLLLLPLHTVEEIEKIHITIDMESIL